MPNVFKMIDKASEKPFNLAVGAAASLAKEMWRRPIITPVSLFAGAVILKAIDDQSVKMSNSWIRTYIPEHVPRHQETAVHTEGQIPEQDLEPKQELQLNDR